ncbi:MAG: fluoride efflux transporter CrcB [Polyangiaceae bacterium]|nr:fluoride efflux transporter CrcB [Polyangiaceae bacterium]
MKAPLLVAGLGAAGSVCRYGVSVAIQRMFNTKMPIGTFVVNVVGSLLIGAAMSYFAQRGALDSRARIAVTVGFLGGFTTYSSFSFETWVLFEEKLYARAAVNVLATVVSCFAACALGVLAVRKLG